MDPTLDPRSRLERLAEGSAERAWRLAYSHLHDPDEARDAVQQAFLVAARKPGRVPIDDPWPWFSVVLVHEAQNRRRKRRPRTNHDDLEVPSAVEPSDALERREEGERLWRALDALPPAERVAVVLTHLGGMTHAVAAEALGLPRQTVSDRARRGLRSLAKELRRDEGATARGFLQTATGGTIMASAKSIWAAGFVVAAGIGFLGGAATDPFHPGESPRASARDESASGPVRDAAAPPPAATGAPTLEGAAPRAPEEIARLKSENARLLARVEEAERAISSLRSAAGASGATARKGPTFSFGEAGHLDAVQEADWAEMAAASHVVSGAVLEASRRTERGEEVPKDVYLRLQENVERIRKYEYRTIDRLPTSAQHNGELTHPISASNLVASELAHGGKPLSADQIAAIEKLGLTFDEEFSRLRQGWSADVVRPKRMLEELRLKGRFTDDLFAVLTQEQRDYLVDPSVRHVAGLDLYDPTLMVIHTSPVLSGATVDEVRTKLLASLRQRLTLPDGPAAPALEARATRFLDRLRADLAPVPKVHLKHYTYAQALAAGEATVDLVEGLLHDLELTPAARKTLVEDPTWYVPRLLAP